MLFITLKTPDTLKELYLNGKISAGEYLKSIMNVSMFGAVFLLVGLVLTDYYVLPTLLKDRYESFGLNATVPLAIAITVLSYFFQLRKARHVIKETDSHELSN